MHAKIIAEDIWLIRQSRRGIEIKRGMAALVWPTLVALISAYNMEHLRCKYYKEIALSVRQ